jgi:hypothetical protein
MLIDIVSHAQFAKPNTSSSRISQERVCRVLLACLGQVCTACHSRVRSVIQSSHQCFLFTSFTYCVFIPMFVSFLLGHASM